MMKGWSFITIFVINLLTGTIIDGQETRTIKRLSSPVEFDGKPDETAWNDLGNFTLTMNTPTFGKEPSEKSEVMIGYDEYYLWIGARLFSKDPSKIVSTSKKRDETSKSSDSFGIILDTYNDNENALSFFTPPSSARIDYAIYNDAEIIGGAAAPGSPPMMAINMTWNTFWDVKTTRDDKGWYVEMRIPFSSLRFQTVNDVVKMGLIINRTISYNNEIDTYPAIDPKYSMSAATKPSLAAKVELQGVKSTRPVYFSPYVIGGYSSDYELNNDSTKYIGSDKPDFNVGGDLKYGITSNLTLDLTANTDFAQVEADDQQVNLTRFSLFFPEKRMFFQERSNLFSFNLGGNSDLFFSRNIGISNDQFVRIYGGARLTGRKDKWEMGLLDMQTARHDTIPSENFGVLRLRKQIINKNSYLGGILTSRIGLNGHQNYAYGLDGIFKLHREDFLSVRMAQSYDNDSSNKVFSVRPSFLFVNLEKRSQKGIGYNLAYSYSGDQFSPGIGFVQLPSVRGFSGNLMYNWLPGEKSRFFNYGISLNGTRFVSVTNGILETMIISPGWQMFTKKGYGAVINVQLDKEGVQSDFSISDSVSIKAGNYSFKSIMVGFMTPMAKPISCFIMLNSGEYYDGRQSGATIMPVLNFSSSFQLSGSYMYNHIFFPDRLTNKVLNIHIVNLKTLYMFNTKLSASVLAQYVNTQKELITNFRLRYNPREGNDFYLVFNYYKGISKAKEIPAFPPYYDRTIMLKYTYTFKL
jgi:hypothetical protein